MKVVTIPGVGTYLRIEAPTMAGASEHVRYESLPPDTFMELASPASAAPSLLQRIVLGVVLWLVSA